MRERVLLFGEISHRPEGLVRAGFALAEGSSAGAAPTPDLALLAVRDGEPSDVVRLEQAHDRGDCSRLCFEERTLPPLPRS